MTDSESVEPFDPAWDDMDVLKHLRDCPNQDHKQLAQSTDIPVSRVVKSLERLREKGKVKYLGWIAVTLGDENLSPVNTSQSDRLTVRWKAKSTAQDTNGNKYAYLYRGKSRFATLPAPIYRKKLKRSPTK
ncbi:winged helix-turn-helix domain-containing protein [Arthrospira sp. PCC 9108]|nr:winged helix-turn-helix domain-containing protein [Arthrospira sp. PCC 9108]